MKTIHRSAVLLSLAAGLTCTAHSQITITAGDVAAQLALSNSITSNTDTLTTSADIGAPGATSWNFSALATHTASTVTSVSVGSTPFALNFPGATHVLQSPAVYMGVPGTGYQYLTLGTNLLNPGLAASFFLGFATATVLGTNAPSDITYALPSTLGTTWTSTYTATQLILLNGSPFSSTPTSHDFAYEVDAYGSLTIPGGTVHDALRIRKVENAGTKTVGYIFLAKDGASVQLTASDTSQPKSGVISVQRKSLTWTAGNPALPVQIASFAASLEAQGTAVRLRWRTLSEVNNYGFEVQKGRNAAGDFAAVPGGFVSGNGTTDAPHDYSFVDPGFSGGTWYYRLRQIDRDGTSRTTEPVAAASVTAAGESPAPARYALAQNYPNPFNPSTDIRFTLADPRHATLTVYDILGREVMTLVDREMPAGAHTVRLDGTRLSSGVYTYVLRAGTFTAARTFVLCK